MMTDDAAETRAHRLEQARRLLAELGYTANSDGSFSPPRPETAASVGSNAAVRGLLEMMARDRQVQNAPEEVVPLGVV
jgi:hypothetical protein